MMRTLLLLALATAFLPACQTNPYTGRPQFLVLSSEADEIKAGISGYRQVRDEQPINTDADLNAPLIRVGHAIAKAADAWRAEKGEEPFQWEFTLIADDKMVNAWCMPGGKIAFYTGIYPVLKDENGMAIVMGHEVAHAMLRHGGERVSQYALFAGGMAAAAIASRDHENRALIMAGLGATATFGIMMPYSRKHEAEADMLGLQLAARAGYDPRAAIGVWERMAGLGGGARPPEFFSTHPDPLNRIEAMQGQMPSVLPTYERSSKMPNATLPNALGRNVPKPVNPPKKAGKKKGKKKTNEPS